MKYKCSLGPLSTQQIYDFLIHIKDNANAYKNHFPKETYVCKMNKFNFFFPKSGQFIIFDTKLCLCWRKNDGHTYIKNTQRPNSP